MRLLRLSGILQGIPESLRVVARLRQAAGVSQSRAGLDIHHELVIYGFNYLCGGVRERVVSCGFSTFLAPVAQSHGCQISDFSARISRCLEYVIYVCVWQRCADY